jgi:hypothetical protein
LREHTENLKNFLTNSTIRYEAKGVDKIDVNNHVNLVMTSNVRRSLAISKRDRRYCLFECDDVYLGNKKFFDDLTVKLEMPETARAVFQLMMAEDISALGNNLQIGRPKTAYYREMQNSSIPSICQFLSHAVNDPIYQTPMSSTDLYKHYTEFHTTNQLQRSELLCIRDFAQDAVRYNGVMKKRSNGRSVYAFDLPALKASLIKEGHFDPDADDEGLPEVPQTAATEATEAAAEEATEAAAEEAPAKKTLHPFFTAPRAASKAAA